MSTMTKIGEMPYLNSEIFYLNKIPHFRYQKYTPKKMGIAIKEKAINSGPISLIDFFNLENLELLDNYCVATKKSANSVFVFSQKKLKDITNVSVTSQTSTSVILLKVLNNFFWKNKNLKIKSNAFKSDSRLIIGDDALAESNSKNYNYKYDLGLEWHKNTGMPFVFAVWAYNVLEENDLINLSNSINKGLNNYDESIKYIVKNNKKPYMSEKNIFDYINGFSYRIGNPEEKAINIFKEMYNEIED